MIIAVLGCALTMLAQQPMFRSENVRNLQEAPISQHPNDGFYVNAGNSVAKIYIYDIGGDLIMSRKITGTSFVNVAQYGSGVYIIKITIGDKSITRKLHIK